MLTKSQIMEQLEKMPNSFSLDEFIDKLILIEKIENGMIQSKKGMTINENELNTKVKEWPQ
jgi:hypothetical protein